MGLLMAHLCRADLAPRCPLWESSCRAAQRSGRQLMTRCGSRVCIAAVETMLTCVEGREAFSSPADALLDELHACSEAYPTPTPK